MALCFPGPERTAVYARAKGAVFPSWSWGPEVAVRAYMKRELYMSRITASRTCVVIMLHRMGIYSS